MKGDLSAPSNRVMEEGAMFRVCPCFVTVVVVAVVMIRGAVRIRQHRLL
jgi:hypothetical protein